MSKQTKSILVPTIFVAIALTLFLPSLCRSGSLEPSDPPEPTMRTLDEIYTRPVWGMFDKTFVDWPDNPRFAVCDNGTTDTWDDMVLDRETGLVWMRDPSTYTNSTTTDWKHALQRCNEMALGGRAGWRLPTVSELASLVDGAHIRPALPSGHPFINVKWDYDSDGLLPHYWTATSFISDVYTDFAYTILFYYGARWENYKNQTESSARRYYNWCVRGGQGVDPQ